MKILFSFKCLLFFVISIQVFAANIPKKTNLFAVQRLVQSISSEDLLKTLRAFLKESVPNRIPGTVGYRGAQQFIQKSILELDGDHAERFKVQSFQVDVDEGVKFYEKDFDQKVKAKYLPGSPEFILGKKTTKILTDEVLKYKDFEGKHFTWEMKGENDGVLVVLAHYDNIALDQSTNKINREAVLPGADHNGSGVSIALNLIKVASKLNLKYGLRVVFLDFQGLGFLGSYQYSKQLKSEIDGGLNLLGVINLEMLGHDSESQDKAKKLGNMVVYGAPSSSVLYKREKDLVDKIEKWGAKSNTGIKFEYRPLGHEQLDNFRFWDLSIPTVAYSQNWEDDFNQLRFHTSNDFPETLNSKTYYQAYRFIAQGILAMLFDVES